MSDDLRPIVVKRIKKVAGGHHGGAWKIAYADFVTAMMAFFLLMWLLASVSSDDLKGVAEVFRAPISISGGAGTGERPSLVPGGGKDLSKTEGQGRSREFLQQKNRDLKAAKADLERLETEQLKSLKNRLASAIEGNKALRLFKDQLLLDITSEGLRIQIVDEQNRPMFALSSAELQPYTKDILKQIGAVLNDVPNRISLSGHTDATPFAGGDKGFSNWELSTDRANASRRALIAGGMDESKVMRVVGLSSSSLMDRDNPTNPINRRISIVVMNKKAEEAAAKDSGGGTLEAATTTEVKEALEAPAKK